MPDPTDIDNPTPYDQIAQLVSTGLDTSGIVEKFVASHSAGLQTTARNVLTFAVRGIADLATLMAQGVFAALDSLDPAFGSIAAAAAGNLFGVEVPPEAFTSITNADSRKQIGDRVGGVVLAMLKGDQANAGPGELEPSTSAAEGFLGTMTNLAVEEWTLDLVGEAVTLGVVRNLGELNETMARALGLTRLARTVLHPFVNTLIAQPAQWSVNKQYRPKMLSVSEAIHAWRRASIDESTVNEIAARDGYGDDAIAALKASHWSPLSAADAHFLVDAGTWDSIRALNELSVTTGDDERSQLEHTLQETRAVHRFELDMIAAAVEAYAAHRIDDSALMSALSGTTISATAAGRAHSLALQRRSMNVPHLSESDVITAVKRGVLNVTDYAAWLTARGYSDVDAVTKELVLQDELNEIANKAAARSLAAANRAAAQAAKAQAALAKRDQTAAAHAHWSGTLGEAERLVVRNVMPPTTYRQVLIDHGIAAGDADELVSVATADRDARAATLAKRASAQASGKTPALAIGTLTHAILLGARQLDDLIPAMLAAGFSQADAQLEHDLVSAELVQKSAAAAARAKTTPAGTSRALTLAQLERAVLNGATTIEAYRAAVIAAGYSVTDTATLVADLAVRLEARKFADERHALAEQRLAASHIPLATMEKAVVDGFQTLTDFQAYLAAHGFDASDQAILTDLLKLKLPAA